MSKGFGAVQRRIIAAFEEQPGEQWTIEKLAGRVYPGSLVGASQRECVRRALAKLDGYIEVTTCRSGLRKTGGWHYTFQGRRVAR